MYVCDVLKRSASDRSEGSNWSGIDMLVCAVLRGVVVRRLNVFVWLCAYWPCIRNGV